MSSAELLEAFYAARRRGIPVAQSALNLGLEEALAAQLAVAYRFVAEGDQIAGWKVGLTSGRYRDLMGEGVRPFGFVLASSLFRDGDRVEFARAVPRLIEPEIALVLAEPLSGAVSREQAKAAVRGVAAAFELAELRVPLEEHSLLLGDALGQWGIVVGDEHPVPDGIDSVRMELRRGGETVATAISGETRDIDDPFLSLARLSAMLHRYGIGLQPGQWVITGSFAQMALDGPAEWRANFGGIGDVRADIG